MKTRTRELKKQQPVLGGYDAKKYRTEQLYATAKDGTKVPISIVYRVDPAEKTHPKNRPMLLLGYGSYGISIECVVLVEPALAARSWNDLRHRAYPRRWRDGQEVARRWPHDDEEEHLHRLHRLLPVC
jgi:oligopeptidase B